MLFVLQNLDSERVIRKILQNKDLPLKYRRELAKSSNSNFEFLIELVLRLSLSQELSRGRVGRFNACVADAQERPDEVNECN
jgi:hypothetical protein